MQRESANLMSEEFFRAIKQGDAQKVEQLIETNLGLANMKDSQGMSPVVVATYYGQSKIAQLLIAKGAHLDIYEASMTGKIDVMKEMILKDKSAVNSFSGDGFTALHLASFFGHQGIASYLIQRGADVNSVARNAMKVMPLHSAVARNQVKISELLLTNGANVNARQEGGFSPLHAAAQSGNLQMAELLLNHGADVNAKTDKGKTPLALTKEEGQEAGPKEERDAVARFLIANGARDM
jgi:uncharacterized protein